MLIAVVGGKLQGVEVLYLARKAGYKTVLIDKNPEAVATKLCDQFLRFQFSSKDAIPINCPPVDLIIPAIEDDEVLAAIQIWAKSTKTPLAFDPDAYKISSSKRISDQLFSRLKLPAPRPWPMCTTPVVVKPSQESGSRGVEIIHNIEALEPYLSDISTESQPIIQEYLEGLSYSIEVIGVPGNYTPLQVTMIHMDKVYDCMRVTAPTPLTVEQVNSFNTLACTLAEEIQLKGIMDVEVVLHDHKLKLLEIDARFPSQTPIAVYWSTGINMITILCEQFLNKKTVETEPAKTTCVSVEHIRFRDTKVEVCGEHIMSSDSPLSLKQNFFGADEALTSYQEKKKFWVATMIFTGSSPDDIANKRHSCYQKLRHLQLS